MRHFLDKTEFVILKHNNWEEEEFYKFAQDERPEALEFYDNLRKQFPEDREYPNNKWVEIYVRML